MDKEQIRRFGYQARFIGFLYTCFKCMAVCPACLEA